MFASFSAIRNRILVVASVADLDCSTAVTHYAAHNADRMSWEDFQLTANALHSRYASISFFASLVELETIAHPDVMRKFYSLLHPGGTINFHLALPKERGDSVIQLFTKACIYAGFVEPHVTRDKENAQMKRTVQLVAQKPPWAEGSAARVSSDGLIDDSTLLDKDEVYVPLGKNKSDCSSKPRACANCSCGRKELEVQYGAEEAKQRLEKAQTRSSCGSCYLGDAFRCSGCPYKGLPAFKPGEKIQLDVSQSNQGQAEFLLAEAEAGESISSSSTTGIIKLPV